MKSLIFLLVVTYAATGFSKEGCGFDCSPEEQKFFVLNSSFWNAVVSGVEADYEGSEVHCNNSPVYTPELFSGDGYLGFRVMTVCIGYNALGGDVTLRVTAEGEFVEGLPPVFNIVRISDRY